MLIQQQLQIHLESHILRIISDFVSKNSLGYAFDGSKYVESSTVMDFYTQTVFSLVYLVMYRYQFGSI